MNPFFSRQNRSKSHFSSSKLSTFKPTYINQVTRKPIQTSRVNSFQTYHNKTSFPFNRKKEASKVFSTNNLLIVLSLLSVICLSGVIIQNLSINSNTASAKEVQVYTNFREKSQTSGNLNQQQLQEIGRN